jgi:hypothetical protein
MFKNFFPMLQINFEICEKFDRLRFQGLVSLVLEILPTDIKIPPKCVRIKDVLNFKLL